MNQIFDIKINVMDNVDLDIISDIESKCFNNDSLTQNELDYYLNYIVYQTRLLISQKKDKNANDYNFSFMCDTAQSMIARYFDKLNINYNPVQTQKAIATDVLGHSFLVADFLVAGEVKSYIIDPTYNQFFSVDKCMENNFKVINGMVLTTPDLGYFVLKSDKTVQEKIKNFLASGYMELSLENAKIYGDLFYKTKKGNINYFNSNLEMSGSIYIKAFKKNFERLTYTSDDLEEFGLSLNPVYNFKKNSIKFS